MVDPVEDGYDLVIRIAPAPDETLVGRRFFMNTRLVVAAPANMLASWQKSGHSRACAASLAPGSAPS